MNEQPPRAGLPVEGRTEEQHNADPAALAALKLPTVTSAPERHGRGSDRQGCRTKTADILAKELSESTQKDSITSANALQTWLHD
jgi:hypothetical protein